MQTCAGLTDASSGVNELPQHSRSHGEGDKDEGRWTQIAGDLWKTQPSFPRVKLALALSAI